MADNIKVKDLPDTSSIQMTNELMVLVDSTNNVVNNVSISDFNSNIISSDADNALVQGTDNKLYIETPSNITGDLDDLTTSDKTNLVSAINELNSNAGALSDLDTTDKDSLVDAINEVYNTVAPSLTVINNSKGMETGAVNDNTTIYSDIVKYAHSTYDSSKFTVTGTPTISNDGILDGATCNSSNYVGVANIDLPNANSFMLETPFLTVPADNTEKWIIRYRASADTDMFAFSFNGKKVRLNVNNVSLNSSTAFTSGQLVKIRFIYDGTNWTIYTQIKGSSWTNQATSSTLTKPVTSTQMKICDFSNSNFRYDGDFDLKGLSIWVNNIPVFNGNKTGIDTIKPVDYTEVGTPTISADGVLSNCSTSNYVTKSNAITIGSNGEFHIDFKALAPIDSSIQYIVDLYNTSSNEILVRRMTNNNVTAIVNVSGSSVFNESIAVTTNTEIDGYIEYKNGTYTYHINGTSKTATATQPTAATYDLSLGVRLATGTAQLPLTLGTIDLNLFTASNNGSIVYQPCLKIPYSESKTGSKVVDVYARPRVQSMYEQYGKAPYYTIDEANANFTLPMGEVYGMIQKVSDSIVPNVMPDYANVISSASTVTANTYIQCTYDSFVNVSGNDGYQVDARAYVSNDNGNTKYEVGYLFDDENANTRGCSFNFFVPKGWYFTSTLENGFTYRIYRLKGAK